MALIYFIVKVIILLFGDKLNIQVTANGYPQSLVKFGQDYEVSVSVIHLVSPFIQALSGEILVE